MKAVLCRRYGEPEDLEVGETDPPALTPDGVRVRVDAAALNFPDILMVQGKYQYKPDFPFSPGMECVGRVTEVGPEAGDIQPGQRVIAHPWVGCFAEEVVAPRQVVFPVPAHVDDAAAAGFGLTYGTVYHALIDRGGLQAGETLLVYGAAGGVGLAAVEVGKLLGATVIAAAGSAEKLAVCEGYGADQLIDYTTEPVRDRVKELTGGRGADVIFDPVGGDMTDTTLRCINWHGRLLIVGFAAGRIAQLPANLVLIKGCEVVGVAYQRFSRLEPDRSRRNMAELMGWWGAGKLKPHVSMTFPLGRTVDAMRAIVDRQSTGQVVVTM